jgi:uncharacterized protein (DUF1800 family)
MNIRRFIPSGTLWSVTRGLLCVVLWLQTLPAGAIDLNSDGVSDVWALFHPQHSQSPSGDPDGDGLTNAQESMAGTDPASPGSVIRVTSISLTGNELKLKYGTLVGKRYQVQSSPGLVTPDWQNVGTLAVGTGGEVTTTLTGVGVGDKFYRILVKEADTDSDGVSDWEELALGMDPNNPRSNGIYGDDDLATVTAGLTAPNVVSVQAVEASAAETGRPGTFKITRNGNLNAITIPLNITGGATAGVDYNALPASVTLPVGANSATLTVMPIADSLVEADEAVIVSVAPSPSYTVGTPGSAAVLISDNTPLTGTGVRARYWNNTSTTIPVFMNTDVTPNTSAPKLDRIETQVNNVLAAASPGPGVAVDYFVGRYTADILPEFSQVYTFKVDVDRGARLWVNGQLIIDRWAASAVAGTYTGTIELQAGRRVPIVLEYMARSGNATIVLKWASANLVEQIIPQDRLFPTAPPQILSPLELLLIKGGPAVQYPIVASGDPTSYAAANLPPGWNVNSTTGLISGSPTESGEWDVALTASNASGSGSALLRIKVISTGGAITREVWNGNVDFTSNALPQPASTALVSSLEGPQNAADNYSARLRGYLTAPSTGMYKFWITGADNAELWISNDAEVVNSFKRAQVATATGYREWTNAAAGKSPLLWLEAGAKYYLEVRHRANVGSDHVSVGWLKPGEGGADPANATAPTEVVPGYALSPFAPPVLQTGESTLYTTSMTAQSGAVTSGYGSSVMRLSADESTATVSFTYANLTTAVAGKHVHSQAHGGLIIFDIDDAPQNPDGSYTWEIGPVGPLSKQDVLTVIKNGDAYINIHTASYPAGEIKGNYRLQAASQTFTPPAPAPAWTDDSANANAAARFLVQSTFGVSGTDANANTVSDDIEQVQSLGYSGWIDQQFALPLTSHYPFVYTNRNLTSPNSPTYNGTLLFNSWWKNSITAQDQLRQRIAFALSQIMVVSEAGPLDDRADALSTYYDTLLTHSFGNFKDLLKAVTLHPAMGRYLDMLRNDKPDKTTGRIPNENYAREILQLFSVGLNRMWPDGSLMLNSKGEPVPTYDQNAIIGFAHAFTGWDYNYTGGYRTSFGAGSNWITSMREVPIRHFTGPKRLMNNVVIPGLPMVGGVVLDPYASHSSTQYNDPAYQALAAQELEATHDQIFNHPNVGPFVCRQLIQRLVTSTPSRGYIYRVVQKFNDNGAGVRGDMKAVIKAILLDYEARSPVLLTQQGYGKQREPLLRITAVTRAFPPPAPVVGTYSQVGSVITVSVPQQSFTSGSSVFLEFSGGVPSDPDDTAYSVISPTSANGTTTFTVRPLSSETGATYAMANATITVTVTGEHSFNATTNSAAYLDFTSGTPMPPDGNYTVTSSTSDEIYFTVPAPLAKRTTYSQSGNVITLTAPDGHSFAVGDSVRSDFVTGAPSRPVDGTFTVASVSGNQLTAAYPTDAIARTGNAHVIRVADIATATGALVATRSAYAVDRNGTVALTYSDWNMGSTDTDLNQTPLRSPTVFNFYEPDYSYPGRIAQAGLITPEFQITSDTSVMRQANFLYSGIFNDVYSTLGLASFRSGGRDLVMDLRPWMANGPGGVPWTNDVNLNALIDKLSTLLLAGQLPSTGVNNYASTPRNIVNAKQVIYDYVRSTTNISYSNTTPTTTQKRDRLRAIVHLIVTSPDFTIQK